MKTTKKCLAYAIVRHTNIPVSLSYEIVKDFFDCIMCLIRYDGSVRITNFGVFKKNNRGFKFYPSRNLSKHFSL